MRKKIVFFLLLFPLLIVAKINPSIVEELNWDEEITLQELAAEIHMPLKKLKECLDLSIKTDNQTTLSELQIGITETKKAIERYNKQRFSYYRSIVFLGMIIVFVSLIITAIFISLLKHLEYDKKAKKQKKQKSDYKRSPESMQVNSNAIVAAITTVFMHEMEVEQQNNMKLTWKRAPLSLWKVSRILPNQEFYKTIKSRGNNEKI